MKNLLPAIFILLAILGFSCDTAETPVDDRKLSLTVEDVSCVEAWIKLKAENLALPAMVNIAANSTQAKQIILTKNDTLLIIDSLQSSTTYSFQAVTGEIQSQMVSARTMDTTSHDFTWQTFEFGEHSSSNLRDIAIIDENNIWAVGEIYMKDSLGQPDPHAYNAVHWDGLSWELKKLLFYTICGQTSLSSYPAKAIHAFNENDIWIAGGGRQLARISGTVQMDKSCLPFSMSINKLWGTSSNNLYAVGNEGTIAHYNGSPSAVGWQKIESGTNLDIYDIWGDYNEQTGEYEILAVAAKLLHSADRDILKIAKNGVEKIDETGIDWSLRGIWFK
ncbi:MAG: glucosyl transferase, partial [Ignavibacteriae bacterium]|nr:glucosyl transferase [Ignavibacteriota bacterium]